jgi:hypothetical protein
MDWHQFVIAVLSFSSWCCAVGGAVRLWKALAA